MPKKSAPYGTLQTTTLQHYINSFNNVTFTLRLRFDTGVECRQNFFEIEADEDDGEGSWGEDSALLYHVKVEVDNAPEDIDSSVLIPLTSTIIDDAEDNQFEYMMGGGVDDAMQFEHNLGQEVKKEVAKNRLTKFIGSDDIDYVEDLENHKEQLIRWQATQYARLAALTLQTVRRLFPSGTDKQELTRSKYMLKEPLRKFTYDELLAVFASQDEEEYQASWHHEIVMVKRPVQLNREQNQSKFEVVVKPGLKF